MKISISPETIEKWKAWAAEKSKTLLKIVISKKGLRNIGLVLVVLISWKYADFFKVPDICNEAQPEVKTTLSIKNPNMRWEEFQGLELRGLLKTSAEATGVGQSYDLITGKPSEKARKFLLNGFLNSFDMKVKGCVETVTVFAKIKTLSGSKAILNETPGEIKLETKLLSTKKQQTSRRKIKNRKCKMELTVKPIDPMAQGAQVPIGDITMSCS